MLGDMKVVFGVYWSSIGTDMTSHHFSVDVPLRI